MATKRRAKTSATASGATRKQLETVAAIARERRLELPAAYERDVAFIRAFLDALAIDRPRRLPEDILRLLNGVRALVEAGLTADELARKLDVPVALGAVLHAYGSRQLARFAPRRSETGEDDLADKAPPSSDLDRLNQAFDEGDESVWSNMKAAALA
jgi:hypothetical protein